MTSLFVKTYILVCRSLICYCSVKKFITDDSKVPVFQYSRVGGIFGQPIAEYVVSYIIAEERKFKWATEVQQTCTWYVSFMTFLCSDVFTKICL